MLLINFRIIIINIYTYMYVNIHLLNLIMYNLDKKTNTMKGNNNNCKQKKINNQEYITVWFLILINLLKNISLQITNYLIYASSFFLFYLLKIKNKFSLINAFFFVFYFLV